MVDGIFHVYVPLAVGTLVAIMERVVRAFGLPWASMIWEKYGTVGWILKIIYFAMMNKL